MPAIALRIAAAFLAGLFWTMFATVSAAIVGCDTADLMLRGGEGSEIAVTIALLLFAIVLHAFATRALTQRLRGRTADDQARLRADRAPRNPVPDAMMGWIATAIVSAVYWLFVGFLLIGMFMGDNVDGAGETSAWPARLMVLGAILLWAAISWGWDRAARR